MKRLRDMSGLERLDHEIEKTQTAETTHYGSAQKESYLSGLQRARMWMLRDVRAAERYIKSLEAHGNL